MCAHPDSNVSFLTHQETKGPPAEPQMLGCARDVCSLEALQCKTYFVCEIGGIGATAAARWELKLNFSPMRA